MKIRLLFFALAVLLAACNKWKKTQHENHYKAIYNGLKSGVKADTLFLDFIFGMTEKEYAQHLRKLITDKKIIETDKTFYYPLKIAGNDNFKVFLFPSYYKGKLCQLRLDTESDDYSNEFNLNEIVSLLEKEHGQFLKDYNYLSKSEDHIWIKGNREITANTFVDIVRIDYNDSSVMPAYLNEEWEKREAERDKAASDL